jgi:hypothetical protein
MARPSGWSHGTVSGYGSIGCRCDLCTQAWADYYRKRSLRYRELSRAGVVTRAMNPLRPKASKLAVKTPTSQHANEVDT